MRFLVTRHRAGFDWCLVATTETNVVDMSPKVSFTRAATPPHTYPRLVFNKNRLFSIRHYSLPCVAHNHVMTHKPVFLFSVFVTLPTEGNTYHKKQKEKKKWPKSLTESEKSYFRRYWNFFETVVFWLSMVTLVIPLKISVKSTCYICKPTGTRLLVSTLM